MCWKCRRVATCTVCWKQKNDLCGGKCGACRKGKKKWLLCVGPCNQVRGLGHRCSASHMGQGEGAAQCLL